MFSAHNILYDDRKINRLVENNINQVLARLFFICSLYISNNEKLDKTAAIYGETTNKLHHYQTLL